MRDSIKDQVIQLLAAGNLEDAALKAARLEKEFPNSGFPPNVMGAIHAQLGEFNEAIKKYQRACEVEPGYPAPLNNLAVVYLSIGNVNEALKYADAALHKDPGFNDALLTRGHINLAAGDLEHAVLDFSKSVENSPQNAKSWYGLGLTHSRLGDVETASKLFIKTLDIQPDLTEAILELAKCKLRFGLSAEALALYQKILSTDPENLPGLIGMANWYIDEGSLDLATKTLRACVHYHPNHGNAYRLLFQLEKTKVGQKDFIAALRLYHDATALSQHDKMNICHALYQANERSGNYSQAFEYLTAANFLQSQQRKYEFSSDEQLFESLHRISDRLSHATFEETCDDNFRPIFVLGMPRSGTSLIEKILSNHEKVTALGELDYFQTAVQITDLLAEDSNLNCLAKIKDFYIQRVKSHNHKTEHFTDKMPLNFRWVNLISTIFPKAKIVHVHRHPQATCFSIFSRLFDGYLGFSNHQKTIASYYKLYENFMQHYEVNFPGRICHLDYDQFVLDPGKGSKVLFDYLNLSWNEDLTNTSNKNSSVRTASRLQVHKSIYSGSSEFWKNYEPYLSEEFLSLKKRNFE